MNKNITLKKFPCRPFGALPSPNQPSRGLHPWLGYTAPSGLRAYGLERNIRFKAKFHTHTTIHYAIKIGLAPIGTSPTLNY